jgi:tetratricopeptide (TPR) repeat protein
VYVFLGNLEPSSFEKLRLYEKAQSYDPNYLVTYIQKGISLAKIDTIKAKKIISDQQTNHPSHFKIYWGLGQIALELQHNNEAMMYLKRAVELNPYHFSSMKDLAYLSKIEGDNGMCIHYYHRFTELNPYDEEVFNYLGLAYDDADRKEEAINCYVRALEVNPNYFESLSNLGLSYQQEEKF